MKRVIIMFIVSAFSVVIVHAAMITVDGKDVEYWQSHSLVYATVENVSSIGHGKYGIKINPIATLTGNFDCGLSSNVILTLVVGEASAISAPPDTGAKIMVLIEEKMDADKQQTYNVPSSIVRFMPLRNALARVSNLEDVAVTETLEKIRKIRAENGK